jgi:ferritin-like metal-binding protein YciE
MAVPVPGKPIRMATTIDTGDIAQLEAGRQLVIQYLNEAHATEAALVTTLQAHITMTPHGSYRELLERHLSETRQQTRAIERRLGELGAGGGVISATYGLIQTVIGQALALSKGPIDLLRGSGGEEKLVKNAKDECATEALEIATYDSLEALANAVGDEKTARLAVLHRSQEERMLAELREHIPALTTATVLARAGGRPSYDIRETGAADGVRAVRDEAGEAVRTAADVAGAAAEETAERTERAARRAAGAARSTADAAESAVEGAERAGRAAVEGAQETGLAAVEEAGEQVRRGGAAVEEAATTIRARDLPIADYDRLNAGQVVTRLTDLSQAELATVAAFERRRRKRRSVLERIENLQGPEPWPGYDQQSEADVIARLRDADEAALSAVRDYEGRHRRRVAVLEAAQQQLSRS